MREITITNSQHGLEDLLHCPGCGDDHLHSLKVEVFNRDEDAEMGVHTRCEEKFTYIDTEVDKHGISRRNYISIDFWCENCHGVSTLIFAQHKGHTEVYWSEVAEPEKIR